MDHTHQRVAGFRRMLVGLGLLGAALACQAQDARALPDPVSEAALKCLQRTLPPPAYETEELRRIRRDSTGYIRVQLAFSQPDRAPEVTLLAHTASPGLLEQAEQFISGYRLPCLTPGMGTVSATQEFYFDRLASPEGRPLILEQGASTEKSCLIMPRNSPPMPSVNANRKTAHVLVNMVFKGGPEDPPDVTLGASELTPAVADIVTGYAQSYRMPCRQAGAKSAAYQQLFTFLPEGVKTRQFKDKTMSLKSILPLFRNLAEQPVPFDFNSMACPFQVDWSLMQPIAPNSVREIGARNPNRAEFLAWLAKLRTALPESVNTEMISARVVLDVPCGVLDLR